MASKKDQIYTLLKGIETVPPRTEWKNENGKF